MCNRGRFLRTKSTNFSQVQNDLLLLGDMLYDTTFCTDLENKQGSPQR
jgi:predicted nicotinamide N-methyase